MGTRITKQEIPHGKLAFSYSGGGPKGAWLVGADQFLREELAVRDEDVAIIMGTSTGSLVGGLKAAAVATGDTKFYADLIEIYTKVNDADILDPTSELALKLFGQEGLLASAVIGGKMSLYDTAPLQKLIDRFMTPDVWSDIIVAGARGELEVGFCAVSLQTGESRVFTNIKDPDPEILAAAMLASSNQPAFMPPVEIYGEQWVDGGVRDFNPIEHVLRADLYDQVNGVVSMSLDHRFGPEAKDKAYDKVTDILLRAIDLLTDQVYDADITKAALLNTLAHAKNRMSAADFKDLLATLPAPLKAEAILRKPTTIVHMHPLSPLPVSGLSFEPVKMRRALRQGFRDARRQVKYQGVVA